MVLWQPVKRQQQHSKANQANSPAGMQAEVAKSCLNLHTGFWFFKLCLDTPVPPSALLLLDRSETRPAAKGANTPPQH
jgi:hypothetical protein